MVPGVEDAGGDVAHDSGGDVAGRFVEDIGKVVLGEQRVGRIRAERVRPWLVLVFARGVDDARGAGLQRARGGVDDGADEGGQ